MSDNKPTDPGEVNEATVLNRVAASLRHVLSLGVGQSATYSKLKDGRLVRVSIRVVSAENTKACLAQEVEAE